MNRFLRCPAGPRRIRGLRPAGWAALVRAIRGQLEPGPPTIQELEMALAAGLRDITDLYEVWLEHATKASSPSMWWRHLAHLRPN